MLQHWECDTISAHELCNVMKDTPASTNAIVQLAICCDAGYALAALVMLTSAKINKSPQSHYCVHLFMVPPCPGLPEQLRELEATDFELKLHETDLSGYGQLSEKCRNVPASTFGRLELSQLLPQLDKVLYIDCDALVLQDLSPLYQTELEEHLIAACPEPLQHTLFRYRADVVGDAPYINAGVMLMNLALMRKLNWTAKVRKILRAMPSHWLLLDQDALNYVSSWRALPLPACYNYQPTTYREDDAGESAESLREHRYLNWSPEGSGVVIVHLAGRWKPWDYMDLPSSDLWLHYYYQSPGSPQLRGRRLFHPLHPATGQFRQSLMLSLSNRLPEQALRRSSSFRLFGILPLWSTQHSADATVIKLFGLLPILRITSEKACRIGRSRNL